MIEDVDGRELTVAKGDDRAIVSVNTTDGIHFLYFDHQGLTALIKELEEVREKLPKPRVEKTGWVAMFIAGCAGPFSTEDEAVAYGKKYPDGFEAAVEVAWGYDVE